MVLGFKKKEVLKWCLVLAVFLLAMGCTTKSSTVSDTAVEVVVPSEEQKEVMIAQESSPSSEIDSVKTFVLTGENFKFMMEGQEGPEMKVKVGDRVKVEFSSTEGFHDWRVDEFQASTEKVREGVITTVEFVADKKGTFEYYCSVGTHRELGMKGKFMVE